MTVPNRAIYFQVLFTLGPSVNETKGLGETPASNPLRNVSGGGGGGVLLWRSGEVRETCEENALCEHHSSPGCGEASSVHADMTLSFPLEAGCVETLRFRAGLSDLHLRALRP